MKVLDLFSGIGGFSLGLQRAGFTTVQFVEIDPFCQKVLNKNFPGVPIHDDIKTFRGTEELADVICGGFPCQDLSCAGTQSGWSGQRSSLYIEMLRIIGEVRPKYCVFENVSNLLHGENGRWFSRFLNDLAPFGYDVQWHCIPASYIGAPHQRDRVWIVAYPPGLGLSIGKILLSLSEKSTIESWDWNGRRMDKPGIIGVANGISDQLDRLKALGNAIVPQIVEIIGRAIMEVENR
jgi:DNA (cytosine-5)-methyltransferase 1